MFNPKWYQTEKLKLDDVLILQIAADFHFVLVDQLTKGLVTYSELDDRKHIFRAFKYHQTTIIYLNV